MKMFMSVAEVAHEVGVSEQTIDRALAAGDLKPVGGMTIAGKPVRRKVVSREALIAWIEGTKHEDV